MRIALLTSTFPLDRDDSDQAAWILEIIRGLRSAGHYVAVYTQHRPGGQENVDGVPVEHFPWPSRDKRLAELSLWNPLDLWAALRLLVNGTRGLPGFFERHQIDLCLVFWALPNGWYIWRKTTATGVPYRVWALGSDINKYGHLPFVRGVLRRILLAADAVYADGFELASRIEHRFGARCEFLGTSRTRTSPAMPKDATAAGPSDSYRFLYIGRLAPIKGVDLLMEAACNLPESAVLSVAGGGPLADMVQQAADQAGGRVQVLGRISDTTLERELAQCDCVVIPSRSETIPIVLGEALQFGKRLIVTDVGDMGYIVRRYRLGEVVPAQDAKALSLAMRRAATGVAGADFDPNGWREASRLFDTSAAVARLAAGLQAQPGERPVTGKLTHLDSWQKDDQQSCER